MAQHEVLRFTKRLHFQRLSNTICEETVTQLKVPEQAMRFEFVISAAVSSVKNELF